MRDILSKLNPFWHLRKYYARHFITIAIQDLFHEIESDVTNSLPDITRTDLIYHMIHKLAVVIGAPQASYEPIAIGHVLDLNTYSGENNKHKRWIADELVALSPRVSEDTREHMLSVFIKRGFAEHIHYMQKAISHMQERSLSDVEALALAAQIQNNNDAVRAQYFRVHIKGMTGKETIDVLKILEKVDSFVPSEVRSSSTA